MGNNEDASLVMLLTEDLLEASALADGGIRSTLWKLCFTGVFFGVSANEITR